jgi:hypothetical protein
MKNIERLKPIKMIEKSVPTSPWQHATLGDRRRPTKSSRNNVTHTLLFIHSRREATD